MNDTSNDPNAPQTETVDESLAQEVLRLRAELADAKDRALRSQAEAENMRKRLRREMDDERKYALLPLLAELLPVVDNVGRAIESAEKTHAESPVVEGFKMVAQQLSSVLEKHQCTKIPALHKPFDPHLHQAIAQQPSKEFPPNTVLVVAQEGYQVQERVLRPAQVIVSTSP
ncbi:MAG TPA: nucleotide exchange factor GrpE [Pirellulales bacterium]|jgi:molecular chaperone GrpE|nr:nucleotide exchange factor GrpE [Pirellulales bacterium]